MVVLGALVIAGATAPAGKAFKPTAEFGHVGIVRDGMSGITRTSSEGRTLRFSQRAIKEVRDADAGVDNLTGEFWNPAAHCDNELLPECSQRIIDLKNAAIAALTGGSPDGAEARRQTGRALHTLQDFYAHSNWIELGNAGPNPALGRSVVPRLASNQQTCGLINTGALTGFGLTNLTSGYFTAIIPLGKCAHGIPFITPGINKDDPDRTGFAAARAAAVAGTTDFVNQVLDAPGVAGNDDAIRAYMDVKGTLGFVIDDTGSMGGIINGVKSVVSNIVTTVAGTDDQPDAYLLVRFGDPDVGSAFVTPSAPAILSAVNALFASGGGDCPELSMSGLLNGIQGATRGSTLYLFTDASSKDAGLVGNVIAAALDKKITINIGLSGTCSPIDPAYVAIAQQTGGQLILTAHDAADTAKLFDLLKPSLSGDLQPLLIADTPVGAGREFSVPIDSTVTNATFSVSMDVKGSIRVFRPNGAEVVPGDADAKITELALGRIVNIAAPATGTWRLSVTGGGGNVSTSVMGNSPIRFDSFDFVELSGPDHEGLFPILGQPVTGGPLPAKANVFGPASSVHFELRSEAGDVLQPIDLTLGGSPDVMADEYFGTLTAPTGRFRVYATGTDGAGQPFVRAFPPAFLAQSVKVEPVDPPRSLPAGSTTVARFKVTNNGGPTTFALTAADATRFVSGVSPTTATLGTNESAFVDVSLTVPAATPDETFVQLSVVARSLLDPSVTNNAVVGFVVGVADTTPPTLTATDITLSATGPDGALVSAYGNVTATDDVDPAPTIACTPAAPHTFPIGNTTVPCTATDSAGNSSAASFVVHVKGAAEQLTDLQVLIDSFGLKAGLANDLSNKVREAAEKLEDGKHKQVCDKLDEFNRRVAEEAGNEPKLSVAQARALLAASYQIEVVAGCLPASSPLPQAAQDTLDLIDTINGPPPINIGLANDLSSKARDVAKQIVNGRPDGACKKLAEFLTLVNDNTGKHLTAARAAALTAAATKVRADLACT